MSIIERYLQAFSSSSLGSTELQATIAALEQQVEAANGSAGGSKRNERLWILAVIKALLAKLGSGQHSEQHAAAVLDPLLHLADACFKFCSTHMKQEDYHVLLYSYMKKLSVANQLHAAMECGQQLLADLQAEQEEQQQSSSRHSSSDLLLGAGLNIIICSCKLRAGVFKSLHSINQAAEAVLQVLR
jgi:hypothetical protein